MTVTCLCALWCDSCEAYRPGFFELAREFPQAVLIEHKGRELFYGPLPLQHEHLRRLIESFKERA